MEVSDRVWRMRGLCQREEGSLEVILYGMNSDGEKDRPSLLRILWDLNTRSGRREAQLA